MPNGEKKTEDEHFIPRTYLRGFSDESERLWFWDIKRNKASDIAVKIDTICRKRNLYEFIDKDNHIILQNLLEKLLCKLENQYKIQREKLISMSRIQENYRTMCFLNRKEKNFWLLYISIQILRLPDIIELCYELSKDYIKNIEDYEAYNLARRICIPFLAISEQNTQEATLLYWLVEKMADMNIAVGVSEQMEFITSDKPIFIYGESNEGTFNEINFPLTSNICIFLFRDNIGKFGGKNKLVRLTAEAVEAYNNQIIYGADEKIFSKMPFDEKMIDTIRCVRLDREKDYLEEGHKNDT